MSLMINGNNVSNLILSGSNLKIYNTVEDLINSNDIIKENTLIKTLGYYTVNDGGGAEYIALSEDKGGIGTISLQNNLYANLILENNKVNVKTIGIRYGSNKYKVDNSKILEDNIIKYNSIYVFYFPKGKVYLGDIHFENAPETFLPHIRICGDGMDSNKEDSKSIIKTEGSDLFYDLRPTTTNMRFVAEDIIIRTEDFLVVGWKPKGICYGAVKPTSNSEVNFRFKNVMIEGFEYGVYVPNYACGGSGGDNVTFGMCRHGIYIKDASHCFNITNVACNYCADGINLGVGGEGNLIRNFHSATGYFGIDKDEIEHYTSIYTRGGLTIDGLYYEPYEASADTTKHIMIDYEPFVSTWGGRPLILRNCNIGFPGAGSTGLFMRIGCYLGTSPGRPLDDGTYGGALTPVSGHYKSGILEWHESAKISKDAFKKLIQFTSKNTEKLLFIGNSIKGECIPEIYDEDMIMNKENCIYVTGGQGTNYNSAKEVFTFGYNELPNYCPNYTVNKDMVSQTLGTLVAEKGASVFMKGRVTITDLADREFDIYAVANDFKHFIGHFPQGSTSSAIYDFDIEIPPYLRDSLSLNTELKITFEAPVETNYIPSTDYNKVDLNYKLGVKK